MAFSKFLKIIFCICKITKKLHNLLKLTNTVSWYLRVTDGQTIEMQKKKYWLTNLLVLEKQTKLKNINIIYLISVNFIAVLEY